jgi:Ca2+/Na+ antiporter
LFLYLFLSFLILVLFFFCLLSTFFIFSFLCPYSLIVLYLLSVLYVSSSFRYPLETQHSLRLLSNTQQPYQTLWLS